MVDKYSKSKLMTAQHSYVWNYFKGSVLMFQPETSSPIPIRSVCVQGYKEVYHHMHMVTVKNANEIVLISQPMCAYSRGQEGAG